MEHTRVIRFFLTSVRTAVMQNIERVVTLISHDDRVTTQVMASFDGRNKLVKRVTCQAVIIVETRVTRTDTRLTKLIDFIRILSQRAQRTT